MTIHECIARHGGIAAVHVTPVTDAEYKVVGWQNIVVCIDGHRVYPTLDEQRALSEGERVPKGFEA